MKNKKNKINGFLGLLTTATCIFTALPVFAQTVQTTNVPFIGGNVSLNITNTGVNFVNSIVVTPLGTATFTGGSITFRNNVTGAQNGLGLSNVGFRANQVGDGVSIFGTSSGSFSAISNDSSFPFVNAPTTVQGQISSINVRDTSTTINNRVSGGSVTLPTALLNLVPTTSIPIVGGSFAATSSDGFNNLRFENGTFLTSLGTLTTFGNFYSGIDVPEVGFSILPGTYSPGRPPQSLTFAATVGGFVVGNIAFTDGGGADILAEYNLSGIITALSSTAYNLAIANGSLLFPTSLLPSSNESTVSIPEPLRVRQTEAVIVTIASRVKSAVASSMIHPDVNNKAVIDARSEQLRVDAGNLLRQNRVAEAFKSLETSRISLLSTYTGVSLGSRVLTIDESLREVTRLSRLTSSPTAVIYPVVLKDRLEILVILPGTSISGTKTLPGRTFRTSVAVPEEALISLVESFRSDLQDYSTPSYLAESKLLYNLLIRPIEAELQASQINTLVFAMDGDLRSIPVAALHDGNQFLVQKYATATVPSLGMANTNLSTSDRKKSTNFLALGLTDSVLGYSSLPNVKTEIDTIGTKILSGVSFLNQDFTVENLQAQRKKQDFNIIHLATHAEFDLENADDSFVLFWDKKLRRGQISQLNLNNLELLTLSACQTAVGNNLGLSGLAVTSGVKSVLASLWSVSDAGTAPLMMKFYASYPDAASKAIALQKAQIALIDGTIRIEDKVIKGLPAIGDVPLRGVGQKIDLKHPYYWSSFILVGNWL